VKQAVQVEDIFQWMNELEPTTQARFARNGAIMDRVSPVPPLPLSQPVSPLFMPMLLIIKVVIKNNA